VTPISEIGPYRFEVGTLTRTLMSDYDAVVRAHAGANAGVA